LAFLQETARDYGDIAYVRVGPYHSYVINHPDLIREVLVIKGKCFRKWEAQKRIFLGRPPDPLFFVPDMREYQGNFPGRAAGR
jgi:hypothetical protein